MGKPRPNMYTMASLLIILGGAIAYMLLDGNFEVRSYSWALAYVASMTTDMVLIKKIVSEVKPHIPTCSPQRGHGLIVFERRRRSEWERVACA